jgi:RimJ/RimL family protein N-acetyltransferase
MDAISPFSLPEWRHRMGTGGKGSQEALAFQARISTGRLRLRPWQLADELALSALGAALAVSANRCATIAPDGEFALTIVEAASGQPIGSASCGQSGLGSGTEVTLWLGEPWWGRGLGTEAAQALIDHAFLSAAVQAVWCLNRVTNPRGRRIVEKCGFQFRGAGMVRLTGRGALPIERFCLDRRSWASLKAWGLAAGPATEIIGGAA